MASLNMVFSAWPGQLGTEPRKRTRETVLIAFFFFLVRIPDWFDYFLDSYLSVLSWSSLFFFFSRFMFLVDFCFHLFVLTCIAERRLVGMIHLFC